MPEKTASPLLDGEAPAGWDTIVRVQKMYFDPPDIDGRMPRVSKWEVIRPYSITSSARASSAKRQSAERAVVDGRVRSSPYTPCGIHRDAGVLARRNERSLRKLQERVLRK